MASVPRWVTLAGALAACAGLVAAPSVAGAAARITVHSKQSEVAAVRQVKWTTNVSISFAKGSWTFKSDGLPASNFVATYYAVPANPMDVSASGASVVASASILQDQNYDYTLPRTPVYTKTVTAANQGPIGFLLDGAALYNPYEANHATVATSDNFIASANGATASFLDDCDGHPGPGGQYHYHGLPACLVQYASGVTPTVAPVTSLAGATTAAVTESNAASRRPLILGFAFDGFGIYDNVAMNGATIPVSSLDACNGIFSAVPGYPRGIYHYVLENVKGVRSSIACYHGLVSSAYTRALQGALEVRVAPSAPGASDVTATAQSLAASPAEDRFLLDMLRLSDLERDC